jgi:hypothetical protein
MLEVLFGLLDSSVHKIIHVNRKTYFSFSINRVLNRFSTEK